MRWRRLTVGAAAALVLGLAWLAPGGARDRRSSRPGEAPRPGDPPADADPEVSEVEPPSHAGRRPTPAAEAWQRRLHEVARDAARACGDPEPLVRCIDDLCVIQEIEPTAMTCDGGSCMSRYDLLREVRRGLRQPRLPLYRLAAAVTGDPELSPCHRAMHDYMDGAWGTRSSFPREAARPRCTARTRGAGYPVFPHHHLEAAALCNELAVELGYDDLGRYGDG